MRLAVCALSAVLLSGCSWLGGMGNPAGGQNNARYNNSAQYGGQYASRQGGNANGYQNPCVVYSSQAPIPQGCDPASVTIGAASGGFSQQPNFGGGDYASAGYGSHAGVAGQQAANYQPRKKVRKPRLRGSLSLGLEQSNSGDFLDFGSLTGLDPVGSYNPQDYNEGFITGTQAAGSTTTTTYTANDQFRNIDDPVLTPLGIFTPFGTEGSIQPNLSFDDVYKAPVRVSGGAEYIFNPKTTFFANAGYSHSKGEALQVASVNGTLYREVLQENFIPDPANIGQFLPNGSTPPNITYDPNQEIARFTFDFTDMRRIDLEAGARHYFNPLVKSQGYKTVTPFVGASVGASHHKAVSFDVTQQQLSYQGALEGTGSEFYSVNNAANRVDLYDSQWVPSGQLNAGVEWQVTPKTALAFESGLKFEGARNYSNGESGDTNIAIPFTVRGSYNF